VKTYRPISTRLRTRRRFQRDWGAHLIPTPRASTARRVRGVAHLGPSGHSTPVVPPRSPLGPTTLRLPATAATSTALPSSRRADNPQCAEEASVTAGATAPAHQRRALHGRQPVDARRSAPAGSQAAARPGLGGRPSHRRCPCPACGASFGRHADGCPARTRRFELAICFVALAVGAALALWLRLPEVAVVATAGALGVVVRAFYQPPPVDVGRGQSRPAPAHRRDH
jgi:hypothetical protein